MKTKQKFVSLKDYAAMNGVSLQTVYNRIEGKAIKPIKVNGTMFIDIEVYPTIKRQNLGRPKGSVLAEAL